MGYGSLYLYHLNPTSTHDGVQMSSFTGVCPLIVSFKREFPRFLSCKLFFFGIFHRLNTYQLTRTAVVVDMRVTVQCLVTGARCLTGCQSR